MGAEYSLLDTDAELPNEGEQFDVAAYAASATFNAVALPPNMPDFLKRAIEAQAERERAQPGPMTKAGTNDPNESKEDRDKKAADRAADQMNLIAQQQQQEREEWAQTQHSFGNTSMTGAEWSKLADDLKSDGIARDWLLDYLMQKGETREEAEQTAMDMKLAASGMSKTTGDRSPEEAAAMQRLKDNPIAADAYDHYRRQQSIGFDSVTPDNPTTSRADQAASSSARADALDGAIAGAPSLTDHHRIAVAAIEPLDSCPLALPPAPQPSNAAGLNL